MSRPVKPADFALYGMLSEPSFSPDGKRIAFSVRRANLANDEYDSEVYVCETRGGSLTKFTSGGKDSDPVWSPDGSSILFLSKRGFAKDEKGSALYVIPAEGGEARLLVKSKNGIENPQWSPDSKAIFYLSDIVKEEKGDVKVIKRFGYWFNGKGFTYNKRKHLFKIDLATSKSDHITSGAFDVTDFAVSHAGKAVAYLAVADDLKPYISDLVVCNLKTGKKAKLTRSNMEISTLSWSPDDRRIAVLGDDLPFGFASHEVVWVVDLARRKLSRPDRVDKNKANGLNSDVRAKAHGPHKIAWEKNGIYFVQADGGSVGLYRLEPGSNSVQVVKGGRSIEGFDVRDGRVAFVAMDSTHLEELYVKAGREAQLTTMNAAVPRELDIRRSEAFSFRASDGQVVEGWVLLPKKKGKVPAILYVHGGPKTAFGHSFMHEFQAFGGAGYAVCT
ncbi:MAG: hypothetical protein LYZ69_02945 [Nitrososphaerales archaeon]|nr:hypothetical protein [Nitrososphaerales archaeon]